MQKTDNLRIAKSLIEEEYYLDAIKILKKLHKETPNSSSIKYELARAWMLSDIQQERAVKYLEKLEDNIGRIGILSKILLGRVNLCKKQYDEAHSRLDKLVDKRDFNKYVLSELMYLAIREEQYEKAYEYYKEILELGDYWNLSVISRIDFLLKYKLGENIDINSLGNYYFGTQLMDYNEEKTLEHIKFHMVEDDFKEKHSVFLDSVNIDELYGDIKMKITSINPSFVGIIDKYTLYYNYPIGITNNEEVDCLNVITLPNTFKILTIFPTYNTKTRIKK